MREAREIQIVSMPQYTRKQGEMLQNKTAKLQRALVPFLAQGWPEMFFCGLSVDGLPRHYPLSRYQQWMGE